MEQYLKNLIEQFKLATGTKNIDIHSAAFINEFTAWIRNRQKMGEEYTGFLDYMGLRFADADCCEIGKGVYDTVVKSFDTKLITPAASSFDAGEMPGRLIDGNMRVYDECPVLVRYNGKNNQLDQIPNDIILTYITQNPFSQSSITNWEDLHNTGDNNIIVGVYGNTSDKDADAKIKLIKELREKFVTSDYIEDYSKSNDSYFYAVGSKRKELLREKVLTR